MSVALWPTANAALNASSAVLLLAGWWCIRRRRIGAHIAAMAAACVVSLAFFVSYLAYHAQAGSVRFQGQGWIRPVYFAILISHTVLAVVIVPLVIRTLWLAARRELERHARFARGVVPLWLYVSVTGVLVYVLLYLAPSAHACPGCSEALFDPTQAAAKTGTWRGYLVSITLLLGAPLLMMGGIALALVRSARRARRASPPIDTV